MPSVSRAFARALVVSALLATGLLLAVVPHAFALTTHKPLNDTRTVTAGTGAVHVGFPIEYFGLVADLPAPLPALPEHGKDGFGQVRFHVAGHWTAWQALDQDGAQQPGHFTGNLVPARHADAYQVRNLPAAAQSWRAAAINTTDGPTVTVGHARTPSATAHAATTCMSRADWGADETMTAWYKGTDTQSYYPVQALTVHHTAGSNDLNEDYAATVRAIYSYDIQTNGWSDMAYHYLIDGHGVVYEGRSSGHVSVSCLTGGGTGSDFAHQSGTDNLVTGAHVANYNAGNAGIALMGCYEASSACSGDTNPPAAAVDSLENLLAQLSIRHHLDPQGTVNYVNPVNGYTKTVATISAHRDWAATACPGGNLYAQLPAIRANVAARMSGSTTTSPPPPPAPAPAAITSGSCSGATCTFSGTGSGTLSWSFGNGKTATGSPVSTKYTAATTYTVTLTDSQPTSATRSVTCTTVRKQVRCST